MQETGVQSLGQEDPLVKGMATHSSILAWRIPWIEEPGQLEHFVKSLKEVLFKKFGPVCLLRAEQ